MSVELQTPESAIDEIVDSQTMSAADSIIAPHDGKDQIEDSRFSTLKRGALSALVLAELTPANEAARGGLFALSEVVSRSPALGALTIGISTLAIEAAGGLAATNLIETDRAQSFFNALNRKSRSIHLPLLDRDIALPEELHRTSKIGWTLLGGTVVGLAIEQREDPGRSVEQNRRYSFLTSAWLAGSAAAAAALASEGINIGINNPTDIAYVGGSISALAGARALKKRFIASPNTPITELAEVDKKTGIEFGLTSDTAKLELAAELEQEVWYKNGYGSLEEYEPYIKHARTFAAFKNGECYGLARLFGAAEVPPFLEMDFYDDELKQSLLERHSQGEVEELGTLAKADHAPTKVVSTKLWRLAYRDSRQRGVKEWGIIMEPERVETMNSRYGFTFKQVGPEIDYQGGMCAPHVMGVEDVYRRMQIRHPLQHFWFVRTPLRR